MLALLDCGRGCTDRAFGLFQLQNGILEYGITAIALIPLGLGPAPPTNPHNIPIGQTNPTYITVKLLHASNIRIATIVQVPKYLISNFSVQRMRSTTKMIELDLEPAVNLRVKGVVLLADLLGGGFLL